MKSKEELYVYCVQKNERTKAWCMGLRQFAMEQMNQWIAETDRFENYYPVVVKLNWQVGIELTSILELKCREQVDYREVLKVADRICQDIGHQLTDVFRLRGDLVSVAEFRVNRLDEAVMYFGPSEDDNYKLFSDNGIIMTEGYNAYMRSRGSIW